jgi:hypothetical protein
MMLGREKRPYKLDFIKMNDTVKRKRRWKTFWEKIVAKDTSDKRL